MVFNHGMSNGGGVLQSNSSPAPMRRVKGHFGFDASISSPQDVKRALFSTEDSGSSLPKKPKPSSDYGEENKAEEVYFEEQSDHHVLMDTSPTATSPGNLPRNKAKIRVSPFNPGTTSLETRTSSSLLCNFEESIFSGRISPVSSAEGFVAKIGASGSFHPRHLTLPVSVYFYSLCDNLQISSPYMGHIDIGKKGYRVPEKGTIQVTLFNPLGTVVKMFIVMYNLSDMPVNSQTFIRQRTLYMPSDLPPIEVDYLGDDLEPQKWLRYVIHLRFASSKSGKIYLHTDIRMIIFNKSDLDTATDFCRNREFELRSYTRTPSNPKFSPRK